MVLPLNFVFVFRRELMNQSDKKRRPALTVPREEGGGPRQLSREFGEFANRILLGYESETWM